MLEALLRGLLDLLRPDIFGFMMVGIIIGLIFGIIPGIGGLTAIALLLSLVWGMQPVLALSFLLALSASTSQGGSITAILVNVPGTDPNAATMLDGFPMALQGKAGRALGAAPPPPAKPVPLHLPESVRKREEARQRTLAQRKAQADAATKASRCIGIRSEVAAVAAVQTFTSCPVPLDTIVNKEVDADGREDYCMLLSTAPVADPVLARRDHALRITIEERHRQLKCFSDLEAFSSRSFNLIVNQVVFVFPEPWPGARAGLFQGCSSGTCCAAAARNSTQKHGPALWSCSGLPLLSFLSIIKPMWPALALWNIRNWRSLWMKRPVKKYRLKRVHFAAAWLINSLTPARLSPLSLKSCPKWQEPVWRTAEDAYPTAPLRESPQGGPVRRASLPVGSSLLCSSLSALGLCLPY